MAKYDWVKIRDDYELRRLSYSDLRRKYGVSVGAISKQSKKDGWNKEESEQLIERRMSNIKELSEIVNSSEQQVIGRSLLVEQEAGKRLRLEGLFDDSIEMNQTIANKQLKTMGNSAELQHVNLHSQITNRNKDGMFGKMPTTQVNIQQNNESMTKTIAIPAQVSEDEWGT